MRHSRYLLIFIALIALPLSFYGQSIEIHEKKKREIEEEIAFLDKQLSSTKKRQADNTKELNFIKRKITNRKKLLSHLDNEIATINKSITLNEVEINRLVRELDLLKKEYSNLIYSAYKHRDPTSKMIYIIASKNINQGYRRWAYFKSFNNSIKDKIARLTLVSNNLSAKMLQLEEMKSKSIKSKDDRTKEYIKLQREERESTLIIRQLSNQEQKFRAQLKQKREEVGRLNREIEKILAAAMKEKSSPDFVESPANRILSDNFEQNRGRLPWPVRRGAVVEEFGQHNHPLFKNVKLPFNNGVNILTDLNAEVYSIFDGVVKQVLLIPGYNQCILLQHGDYYTFYCKLDKVSVKIGDNVKRGASLGTLAPTDEKSSTIHFQLWRGTDKQNPEHWISK